MKQNNIKMCVSDASSAHNDRFLMPTSNVNLERRGNLRQSVGFIALFLVLEISKQMLNFKMATQSKGKYPLPSPVILFLNEIFKLSAVISYVFFKNDCCIRNYQPSLRFSVPAICYFFTNLLYLHALKYVAPPMWMILIQTRTIFTAIVYKLVFGRSVTLLQMAGCVLIVLSIPTAKLTDILESDKSSGVTPTIIGISQACAILSTIAAISVELLLKNDYRSFAEQQIWLYTYGALYAIISLPFFVTVPEVCHEIVNLRSMDIILLATSVTVSALGGLCIPFIVKNLDTIVKDYLGAANNILLSTVTALMFPSLFTVSWMFICSLVILFAGIILYERFASPKKILLPVVANDNNDLKLSEK